MTELNFDSTNVTPVGSFEPLPLGEYNVIISASEKAPTKSGSGTLLKLTFDVVGGEYNGRKIFERLNIVNENDTAQKIGQQALSAICYVTGVERPKHSEELHNKPFIVRVGIRPAKDGYNESNYILEYKYADGRRLKDVLKGTGPKARAANMPAATNAAGTTEGGKAKRPWE